MWVLRHKIRTQVGFSEVLDHFWRKGVAEIGEGRPNPLYPSYFYSPLTARSIVDGFSWVSLGWKARLWAV